MGHAILYEIVLTIMGVQSEAGLRVSDTRPGGGLPIYRPSRLTQLCWMILRLLSTVLCLSTPLTYRTLSLTYRTLTLTVL